MFHFYSGRRGRSYGSSFMKATLITSPPCPSSMLAGVSLSRGQASAEQRKDHRPWLFILMVIGLDHATRSLSFPSCDSICKPIQLCLPCEVQAADLSQWNEGIETWTHGRLAPPCSDLLNSAGLTQSLELDQIFSEFHLLLYIFFYNLCG